MPEHGLLLKVGLPVGLPFHSRSLFRTLAAGVWLVAVHGSGSLFENQFLSYNALLEPMLLLSVSFECSRTQGTLKDMTAGLTSRRCHCVGKALFRILYDEGNSFDDVKLGKITQKALSLKPEASRPRTEYLRIFRNGSITQLRKS